MFVKKFVDFFRSVGGIFKKIKHVNEPTISFVKGGTPTAPTGKLPVKRRNGASRIKGKTPRHYLSSRNIFNEWLLVGLGRLVVWDSNRDTPNNPNPYGDPIGIPNHRAPNQQLTIS